MKKLHRKLMRRNVNAETYHWLSTNTGRLAIDLFDVIWISLDDLIKYHFINRWRYGNF